MSIQNQYTALVSIASRESDLDLAKANNKGTKAGLEPTLPVKMTGVLPLHYMMLNNIALGQGPWTSSAFRQESRAQRKSTSKEKIFCQKGCSKCCCYPFGWLFGVNSTPHHEDIIQLSCTQAPHHFSLLCNMQHQQSHSTPTKPLNTKPTPTKHQTNNIPPWPPTLVAVQQRGLVRGLP